MMTRRPRTSVVAALVLGSLVTVLATWQEPTLVHEGIGEGRGASMANVVAFGPGGPGIAYQDWNDKVLMFASLAGGEWVTEVVDPRCVGVGLDLVYTAGGRAAISYGRTDTRFAEQQADGTWKVSVVDRAGAEQTALAVDAQGNPWILYDQLATTNGMKTAPGRLLVAHRENGRWVLEEVASAPRFSVGDISFNQGTVWIAYGVDTDGDNVANQLHLDSRGAAGDWAGEVVVAADGNDRCAAGDSAQVAFDAAGSPALVHVPANCQDGTPWNSYAEFVQRVGSGWCFEDLPSLPGPAWDLEWMGGEWYIGYSNTRDAVRLAVRSTSGVWSEEQVATPDGPTLSYIDEEGKTHTFPPQIGQASFAFDSSGRPAFSYELIRYVLGAKGPRRGEPVEVSDLMYVSTIQ